MTTDNPKLPIQERLRLMGAMLVHADALSLKPKAPNEVETTCITTTESRLLWAALSEAAETIGELVEALTEARLRLAEIEGAGKAVVDLLDIEAWTGTAKQLDSVLIGCRNTAAEIDPILAKVRP